MIYRNLAAICPKAGFRIFELEEQDLRDRNLRLDQASKERDENVASFLFLDQADLKPSDLRFLPL
jgi:hypothetical protein